MPKSAIVKTKGKCCQDRPRCKRCPVVLDRLDRAGFAERSSRREYVVSRSVPGKVLARARKR